MTHYGIKPEWAQAWRGCRSNRTEGLSSDELCADLALHLLAGWMESEFNRQHEIYLAQPPIAPDKYCAECGHKSNWDERHNYDHAAWLEAARKVMEGKP